MKDEYDTFRNDFLDHLPRGYVFEEIYTPQSDNLWIGYGAHRHRGDDAPIRLDTKPYEEIKTELHRMLEPYIGLIEIDEITFGIWTIHAGH